MNDLTDFAIASLLVSLRIAPTLAFAPPFTLVRIPAVVRLMLAISLAAWIVASHPAATSSVMWRGRLIPVVFAELTVGIGLGLALQIAFAAMLTVGRTIDLQAGYAFAMLADPSSRTQSPLIGMLFAYAAAAIFFASSGPADLLAIWAQSLDRVPLGGGVGADALPALTAYIAAAFVLAFGAGGLVLVVLFMIDVAIALMSRTLPQMNVLFLGFQVKAIATLLLLPVAIASGASLFLRLIRFALETTLKLI